MLAKSAFEVVIQHLKSSRILHCRKNLLVMNLSSKGVREMGEGRGIGTEDCGTRIATIMVKRL